MNKHQHVFRSYLFVAIMVILGAGCKDDVAAPPQSGGSSQLWQLDQYYFRSDKILLNGYAANGTFTVAGFRSISVVDSLSLSPQRMVGVGLILPRFLGQ